MNNLPEFVMEREFNAPRNLVWNAWTKPKYLNVWYGPNVETVIHKFELEPGGVWLNEMKMGENSFYQKSIFQTVNEPDELVMHMHSNTDEDWNDVPHPMMEGWPRVLLTTITLEENGDKTKLTLKQVPMDASDEEAAMFGQAMSGMGNGWGKGFEILETLLADMQSS